MQGYTLPGQGLRAYKVNGPWLKQVWSCSWMGKNGGCQVLPRPLLLWCEFMSKEFAGWTCRLQTKVEDPLSANTLQHRITWPREQVDWLRRFKGRNTRWSNPASECILLCHFSPTLLMSHQLLYHELKKAGYKHSSHMTRKQGAGYLRKHACGLFVMCCWLLVLFLPDGAACLHQCNLASKVLPSHWSWQDFPGLPLVPEGWS